MAQYNGCGYEHRQGSCGWQTGEIRFISRYREQNDYCISYGKGVSKRITINDDGSTRNLTADDLEAFRLYSLFEYSSYCLWHAEMKVKNGEYLPPLASYDFNATL